MFGSGAKHSLDKTESKYCSYRSLPICKKGFPYNPESLFSGIAQFTDKKPISDEFCQCAEWEPFQTNFFLVSIPKIYGVMHEIYISWLGYIYPGYTANVKCHDSKCQMYSYLAVCW